MVLVGRRRRHGRRGLGRRAALPGLGPPAGIRHAGHGGQRTADHAGRRAERGAGGGRGDRPLHRRAAGDHRPTAPCCSSGSPWPRGAWSPRPPTSWAACGASIMVGPGGQLEPASVVATDKTSDVALVSVPEDLPVAPFADDAGLDSGHARPRPHPRARRGQHAVALHCTPGSVTDVGTRHHRRPGLTACPPSPRPVADRRRSSPASRCSNSAGRRARDPLRPAPGHRPPPPSCPPTWSSASPTTCARSNRVVHGWLGVAGHRRRRRRRRQGGRGRVRAARPPAASRPGQVIVALDSQPVRTMAELRARLYVLPPGTAVAALGPGRRRDQGRGRDPRHLLVACEGEHVRFQRPRQPDGGPPRGPA